MADSLNWALPPDLQPDPARLDFDLDSALDTVVLLRAEIPEDAFTAQILGTNRMGNGVVIGEDGIVLTIGYLITEASSIWLTTNRGTVVPGHPIAYDQSTGFGLVQPLGRLGVKPIARGSAASCEVGDDVIVAGHGGRSHALKAKIFAKREFAGSWEYVLDEAIFTAPAHPQWSGAALLGADGRLLGIGSLFLQEQVSAEIDKGNMMVPIDLLEPILGDLLRYGQAAGAPRPWLGMYVSEIGGHLVVAGMASGGPADRAGIRVGDILLEAAGKPVSGLAALFRSIWQLGPAGCEVPFIVARNGARSAFKLRSADRKDFLKKPLLH